MKKTCRFFISRTALTLFLFFCVVGIKAKSLTVFADANNVHGQVPISGVYFNYYTKTQYVIPAANLTSMIGGGLYCLVYWPNELNDDNMFSGDVNVYVKEVDYTTISKFESVTDANLVYSGPLEIQKSNNMRLVLISLKQPYIYKGGNLLIDFENQEPDDPVGKKFYGKNVTGASISASEKTKEELEKAEPYQHNFIPRTSFLYYSHPDITGVTSTPTTATVSWTGENTSYRVRYSEISFFDDFEDGLNGWTVVRDENASGTADTDWHIHRDNNGDEAYDGEHSLITRSWYNGNAYSTDCWLISPEIDLGGTLKFWVRDDGRWHEKYNVYISTTNKDIKSFKLLASPGNASRTWSEVSIDLSDYEGDTGYIALRDQNEDQDYLLLDKFGVYRNTEKWTEVTTESSSYTIQNLKEDASYLVEVCGLSPNKYVSPWEQCAVITHSNPMPFDANDNQTTSNASTISWSGFGDSYQFAYRIAGKKDIIKQGFEKGGDYEGWTLKECKANTGATSNEKARHTGYAGFGFNSIDMTTPQYLISPKLAPVTEGTLFSFYYRARDERWPESFRVGFSSTTDDIDAFTFGDTRTIKNEDWIEFQDFIPVGTQYVCIQCTSENMNYLFVDDIEIYQPQIDDDWNILTDINDKTMSIEGLEPDTQYEVRIRSMKDYKAGNTASDWMRAYSFTTLRTLPLPDDDTYATQKNTELLGQYDGFKVDVSIPARMFTASTPSTICLPFDYTPVDGMGTFYTFSGIEKEGNEYVATMKENTVNLLTANTPYLFMPASTGEVDFSGVYTVSAGDATSTTSGDWTFKGTYSRLTYGTEPMTGHVYGFASKTKEVDGVTVKQGEFIHAKEGASVPAMRCYLTYKNGEQFAETRNMIRGKDNEVPQSIIIRFEGEDSETGLSEELRVKSEESDNVYDLSGRKINCQLSTVNSQLPKGIYIKNGKKILVK